MQDRRKTGQQDKAGDTRASFTFRPPADVAAALDAAALDTGIGRSAIVVQALRLYLGIETSQAGAIVAPALDGLAQLRQEVAELRERMEAIGDARPARHPRKTISTTSARPAAERPRPPAPVSGDDEGWLTVRQAFEALGGDPNDPDSAVRALDGRPNKWLSFKTNGKNPDYFPRFGLEVDADRKASHRPWLRFAGDAEQ